MPIARDSTQISCKGTTKKQNSKTFLRKFCYFCYLVGVYTVQQQMQSCCKVSKNVLKNKIKEYQNLILENGEWEFSKGFETIIAEINVQKTDHFYNTQKKFFYCSILFVKN